MSHSHLVKVMSLFDPSHFTPNPMGGQPTHLCMCRGFPLQKANKHVHPEKPIGIRTQPLWHIPHPLVSLLCALHTKSFPGLCSFWRVLTTIAVGNVTQGQGVPDHQVLPTGGAQHIQACCRLFQGGFLPVQCASLPCGGWAGGGLPRDGSSMGMDIGRVSM